MSKDEFIKRLDAYYIDNDKYDCVMEMHLITRLSTDLCSKLISSIWTCSHPEYFGDNIYQLLEVSADGNSSIQFDPKLKEATCGVYIIYPDEHAAAFALYKINKYKP